MRRSVLAVTVLAASATLAFAPRPVEDAAAAGWYRVVVDGEVASDDLAELDAAGAAERAVLSDGSFGAYLDPAGVERVDTLAGVGVEELPAATKIASHLADRTGTVRVDIVTAIPSAAGVADAVLRDAQGVVHGTSAVHADRLLAVVRADVRTDALATLAARRDVLAIGPGPGRLELEDEVSNQILADQLVDLEPVVGYRDFLGGIGLTGAGVRVAITDDGLDPTHPDLAGRIAHRYSYGPENDLVPAQGHGTHVAGIVGGLGADIGPLGPLTDADGFSYGLGVAPGVEFVDQPIIQLATSATAFREVGFERLVADARAAGANLWNASWTDGGGAGAGYVANAASLDGLTRDADADEPGEQPFTFVFSAGNSGAGEMTITSPKEAKNIIVVGSSRNARAGFPDEISSFSSRGPARDGRILPTVVAPGERILSARAATGVLCTAPLSGTGDAPPADGLTLYTGCSGTSMAAPHAAGAVALLHEWWTAAFATLPSPAMTKGSLVNNARDLFDRDVPNNDEGWGIIDLSAMFDADVERILEDQTTPLAAGDESTLQVEVVEPLEPLRVTVAWTDAAGAPTAEGRALVNDLDLEVTGPDGTVYLGNVFLEGASVAGGQADELNNLENVWLDVPEAGTYTITVRAREVLADAVTATETADQDFALLVRNARAVS